MGHLPLLDELALIAVLAVVATLVLTRLKLPAVAGLLATGALVGPHGLSLATSTDAIEVLAEVGVVFLLFSVGLEFSLSRLKQIFQRAALGAALQVGLTILVTWGIAWFFGAPAGAAVFYGFVFALSSTAIVLRALSERHELDAPHGRFIVATLVFQDLCVIPMVLVIPLLGTNGPVGTAALRVGVALGKAALVVALALSAARYVVPRLFALVDASRSREVFLLAVLALCTGTAWLTSQFGLSLALGAFLAGVVLADTEYGHRAMGDILPLKDAFVSLFFISLGMLFEPRVLVQRPMLVLALFAGFLLGKGVISTLAALFLRFPSRVAWLAGVGLAQFGEFGFVLTRLAEEGGLVPHEATRPLLAAGILSMFATPLLVRLAPHVTAGEKLLAPLARLLGVRSLGSESGEAERRSNHVVIVGFGLAGRRAARALHDNDVPFVVLELNADNVRKARLLDLPVFYGDATSEEALRHAYVEKARMVVLLMNDPQAAQRVVATVRRVAPNTAVMMRTHYLTQSDELFKLGASDVVAEEVESAVEVIARMLRTMDVPRNIIDEVIRNVRKETQNSDRRHTMPRAKLGNALADMKIESALVQMNSPLAGASLISLQLRKDTGALVVGVRRGETLLENPDPTVPFEPGDVVYLAGTRDALRRALALFDV